MFKFKFDNKINELFYFADYFKKSKLVAEQKKPNNIITMQWFQRKDNIVLCGIEYILQLLEYFKIKCDIEYLEDGSIINNCDIVLKITGLYQNICHFEGFFDGILARCSSIATNAFSLSKSAKNKPIINMGDRADIFLNQEIDGYASIVGGIKNLVTPANYDYLTEKNSLNGTMPHALIALFDGDIIKACEAYIEIYPENELICLIDYNNDCINDALKVASHFKEKLKAVRIDTSDALIDKSLKDFKEKDINGVNIHLVKLLRAKLDENNFNHVKIIVSSGFNEQKINYFEQNNTCVDIYGVGESLFKRITTFTGDLVKVNGKNQAKFGRNELFNDNLLKKTIK